MLWETILKHGNLLSAQLQTQLLLQLRDFLLQLHRLFAWTVVGRCGHGDCRECWTLGNLATRVEQPQRCAPFFRWTQLSDSMI